MDEVKHIKASHAAIDALTEAGLLTVADPEPRWAKQVTEAAKRTGDLAKLSAADVSIIALALGQKISLFTDDYAAANVAAHLGIPVQSSTGKSLKEARRWTSYCSACGKSFGPDAKECSLCGNALRRKFRKKAIKQPASDAGSR